MDRGSTQKIIFAIFVVLFSAGYYFISGKHENVPGNAVEEKTEKAPDVALDAGVPGQGTILDGSDRTEVASGTFESDPGAGEREPAIENTASSPVTPPKPPQKETPTAKNILFSVPFTSQAPYGNWSDARNQDGCEEAAVIMAMAWVNGTSLDAKTVNDEIYKIAAYEEENVGTFHDTSAFDTAETIFKGYFKYERIEVRYRIKIEDIINELEAGNIVIVPTRGQLLGNPNFTPPGPLTHELVVVGYDFKAKEFITNDPGTRNGKGYRYDENVLIDAVVDYPTGSHEKIVEEKTAMIVVRPPVE